MLNPVKKAFICLQLAADSLNIEGAMKDSIFNVHLRHRVVQQLPPERCIETVCAHHWLSSLRGRNPLLSSHAPLHPITCLTRFNVIFFSRHTGTMEILMVFSRHQRTTWLNKTFECWQVSQRHKIKTDPVYILMNVSGLIVNYASMHFTNKQTNIYL